MVRVREQKEKERSTIGRPKVGGPFALMDHFGQRRTSDDFKGRHMLVYFGFTMCPDICPEELDKMAQILKSLKEDGIGITPMFITCDPARDTPDKLKDYLAEFHPDILGLTGTYEEIKQVCKSYRVYFSTPPSVKPGQDYLVDHSIFFYLMDPEGNFEDALGRLYTAEQATSRIKDFIQAYQQKS